MLSSFFSPRKANLREFYYAEPTTPLYEWWMAISMPIFGGHYYNSQLVNAYSRLNKSIKLIEKKENERRVSALHKLYNQILNWQIQRQQQRVYSSDGVEEESVTQLKAWVENELRDIGHKSASSGDEDGFQSLDGGEPYDAVRTFHTDAIFKQCVASLPAEPSKDATSAPASDVKLYDWWMKISRRRFYQLRSAATRSLDQAILWYCDSIILDRANSLKEVLIAIDVWRQERAGVSSRVDAVKALQDNITQNIQEIERFERNHSDTSYSYHSMLHNAYLVAIYFIQDALIDFDPLLEFFF